MVQGVLALLAAVLWGGHRTVARPRENNFWLQPDGLITAQGCRRCRVGQGHQVLACVSLGTKKNTQEEWRTKLLCLFVQSNTHQLKK